MIIKLKSDTGQHIYSKNLPLNSYNPESNNSPLFVKGLGTNDVLVIYQYSDASNSNFAAIRFDDN